jgi:hypothetical protein
LLYGRIVTATRRSGVAALVFEACVLGADPSLR